MSRVLSKFSTHELTPLLGALQTRPIFGTTFPSNPLISQRVRFSSDATERFHTDTLTKSGETGTNFEDGDIHITSIGTLYISESTGESDILNLGADDMIVLRRTDASATDIVITLSAVTKLSTYNSVAVVYLTSSEYTKTGPDLVDEATYSVLIIKRKKEFRGAEFEYNGTFWELKTSGAPSVESVPFGDNWILLFNSDSGLINPSAVITYDLEVGQTFQDYSWLRFVARGQYNDHYRSSSYVPVSVFVAENCTVYAADFHAGIEYVDSNSFRMRHRYSTIRFHQIWGHK